MTRTDAAMVGIPKYERVENDFYPTPPDCTEALYTYLVEQQLLQPSAEVFEPACGDGAIVKVFQNHGHRVTASDLYPQLEGAAVKDFLTDGIMLDRCAGVRALVVTNPPYAMPYINAFMDRMNDLVHNDGVVAAMLMRNEVDCAKSRRVFFEDNPYYYGKLVLTWRPRWIAGSTGSPRHNYAWYIWAPEATDPLLSYAFK